MLLGPLSAAAVAPAWRAALRGAASDDFAEDDPEKLMNRGKELFGKGDYLGACRAWAAARDALNEQFELPHSAYGVAGLPLLADLFRARARLRLELVCPSVLVLDVFHSVE